ncbi:peroxiredoxin [Dyella lutea]|uniref:Glutathione-dependent peroxiredoxin n=1 Tax=Dyella lutea TaxID=2950441 RepID=A0ABT1FFB1_9GAMM|nr:peroxiredoxin [Dyella lutea]MCP1376071.1 peroxiredoxin [Dyella lutea]
MTIQTGQPLPDVPLTVVDGGERQNTRSGELFAGRKVVMFAVPGAFTPTCSEKHLPGFVTRFDAFRVRGFEVFCLSVNDAFVMQAWALAQGVPPGLKMLADGNGEFTRALGLELDGSAYGMGLRARRFALVAEDGVVTSLAVEAPGEFRVSSAEAMLDAVGG